MEIIDKTKVTPEERAEREEIELLQSLVEQKQHETAQKYVPNEARKAYLKTFKESMYNRLGLSQNGEFAVVAQFPLEVNVDMINKHGSNWINKPGLLNEFLNQYPCYKMGSVGLGFQGGQGGLGEIKSVETGKEGCSNGTEATV